VAPEARQPLKRNLRRSVVLEHTPAGARVWKRFHAESPWRRLFDRARAAREAQRAAAARAAGLPVPRVLEVGEDEGHPAVAFEWIVGAAPLAGAALAPIPGLARRLGAALARAHAAGLAHGDLHAGNILIDGRGAPWLVDLRAARVGVARGGAALLRDLAQLGADLREGTSPLFRARCALAWWRALPSALREGLPPRSALLAQLEDEARRARRDYVRARVSVHRRDSSATRRTTAPDAVERRAPLPEGAPLVLTGASAGRAYDAAVRLELHGIPAPRPLRLVLGPEARAELAAGACAPAVLLGRLLDRGLAFRAADGAAVVPDPALAGGWAALLGGCALADDDAGRLLAACAAAGLPRDVGFWTAVCAEQRGTRAQRRALARAAAAPHGADAHGADAHGAAPPGALRPAPAQAAVPLRRRARAALLRGGVQAARGLPPAATAAIARGLAALAAQGPRGALARANLARALGADLDPAAQRAVLAAAARFAGRQLAEWLRLAVPCAPGTAHAARGAWIDAAVELDPSIARLDAVLAEGRGAVVVTAHIGNWELLCARLVRRGHTGAVIGRVRERDPSHSWLTDMRRAYGVETIPQDASPRRALAVLAQGGVVGVLSDLYVKRLDHLTLEFLGQPAPTLTAPAAFARAYGGPLVPIRCVAAEGGRGRYRLVVEEPLELARSAPRGAAQRDLLQRLNDVYSGWIRADPEQWAWHQRRWPSA